ncbi:expansin-B5-like isoform X2 [Miscanthus floridulus]|uniref:expansin-B5-like isoform X2 n=1 Tax=Miscanthus floridulus TaxID=154761 RepID=UPI003457909A
MATTQLTRGGGLPLAVLFFIFLVSGASAQLERTGTASWVGAPDGAGNENGGCGFGDTITVPPFSALVTGFGNDDECGMCYQVRCTGHPACWSMGVRVTVTDSCRSALCAEPNNQHFDMAGHAFGAMAKLGRAAELRAAGNVTVEFEAEDCHYTPPSNLPPNAKFPFFKVDPSATKDNFSVTLLYTEGWASWKEMRVLLANAGNRIFSTMTHSHGATWKYVGRYNLSSTVSPPMSMMVYTSSLSDPKAPTKVVSMTGVIPQGWQPGAVYFRLL